MLKSRYGFGSGNVTPLPNVDAARMRPAPERTLAVEGACRHSFEAGTTIFREGERGSHVYLIERGCVEISTLRQGRPVLLDTLGEGDLFGEMSLIDQQVRTASATAAVHTDVIAISRSQIEDKLRHADPALHLLLRVVLKRFRSTRHRMLQRAPDGPAEVSEAPDADFDDTRERAVKQIRLVRDLCEATKTSAFELHYQPIVSLDDGCIAGFEALIRWRHPTRGLMVPGQFLAVAEDAGLASSIGLWVLEHAASDLREFQRRARSSRPGRPPPYMSVNLSPQQIQEPGMVLELATVMHRLDVDPRTLVLEITEGSLIENPEHAASTLGDLKRLGVRLALDDFGTGYSSLSYLQRFPPDVLKIDRSFVAAMLESRDSLQIVRGITGLARALSLTVIAEGVERNEELAQLRSLDCGYAQGYLLARPMPARQAGELLKLPIHATLS